MNCLSLFFDIFGHDARRFYEAATKEGREMHAALIYWLSRSSCKDSSPEELEAEIRRALKYASKKGETKAGPRLARKDR